MNDTLIKIIKWIVFIPVVWIGILLFKAAAMWVQYWIREQVHEASGWGYFVAQTTFGWFWIPYMLLGLGITIAMDKLCPKPKIGAAILLTILVLGAINFYFVSGHEVLIAWVFVDITSIGTLAYIIYEKE